MITRLFAYLVPIILSCKLSFGQTPSEIRSCLESSTSYLYEQEFSSINEGLKDWYLSKPQQNQATLIATTLAYQHLIDVCFFCAESVSANYKQGLQENLNSWNTLQNWGQFPVKIFLAPASAIFPRAKGYWHVLMAKEKARNEIETSFFAKVQTNITMQIREFLNSKSYKDMQDKKKYNLLATVSKHYSLLNFSEDFGPNFETLTAPYLTYFLDLEKESLDYLENEFRLKLIGLGREKETRIIYSFLIAEWSQTPS